MGAIERHIGGCRIERGRADVHAGHAGRATCRRIHRESTAIRKHIQHAPPCRERPHLRAIVWDRPEVLKVADEMARTYGVADRLECLPGDMFADPVPADCDAILLSNVLHDWDVPQCRSLLRRLAQRLRRPGQILIHDVFLNNAMDGPLPLLVITKVVAPVLAWDFDTSHAVSVALTAISAGPAAAEPVGFELTAALASAEVLPMLGVEVAAVLGEL